MSDFGNPTGYGRVVDYSSVYLTTPVTAHTKGSYFQVAASLPFDVCSMLVQPRAHNQQAGTCLMDIAVGAAASERVILADFLTSVSDGANNSVYDNDFLVPISIPAGSRISMRAQSSYAGVVYPNAVLTFYGAPLGNVPSLGRCTSYGINSGSSTGTAVTAPSSGNGSYAQLTASTTNPMRGFLLAFGYVGTRQNYAGTYELAIGAASSEQVILSVPFLTRTAGTNPLMGPSNFGFIWHSIPAGTRLSARIVFGGGTAPGGMTVAVYGID